MTVSEMASKLELRSFCMPDGDRQVTGGYAGDLLSWVMGRANAGDAWVTIMSNVNIVAVATLADPACIILSEGVEADSDTVARARSMGVNVLGSVKNTFELCAEIAKLI